MKRLLSLTIILAMLLGALSLGAFTVSAAESGTWGNLTWTLDDEGTLTISGNGEMKELDFWNGDVWASYAESIKTVVIKNGVTTISKEAFYYCTALKSVTIPNSVTTIGDYAFYWCESLKSITIPDGVTTIGDFAFGECFALESVTIPNSVTTIGDWAFWWCESLESITIPDGVTTIGDSAFSKCFALESVTIPDSVTTIGDDAFGGCVNLTSIDVKGGNTEYCDVDGVLFNKDKTTLVQYPTRKTNTAYTIPDSVTTIGDDAFDGCLLLESVTIGDNVITIGDYAFSRCGNLTSIDVKGGNTEYCDADGVLFNKDKTTLVKYPAGKTNASYTIPNSVTTIGDYAFCECLFLESVTIGDNVTSIGTEAFFYCALKNVSIGDGVTVINDHTFGMCIALESITIPDSVTTVGYAAFYACSSLETVNYGGSEGRWNNIEIREYNDGLLNANVVFGATDAMGDVNGDTYVDNLDAAIILKYDAGIADEILESAEVNGDGYIDNLDAAKILKYDAGIIDQL